MISGNTSTQSTFPQASLTLEGAFEAETLGLSASDREDHYRRMLEEGRPPRPGCGKNLERSPSERLEGPSCCEGYARALTRRPANKKALLIGLVLAHAELTAKVTGMTPLLLLDEVAAHLDPSRRVALFDRLETLGGQVFMTGTDVTLFEALPKASELFEIKDHNSNLLAGGTTP